MSRTHVWQVGHRACFLGYSDKIGSEVGQLPPTSHVVVAKVGTGGDLLVVRLDGPGYRPHQETVWPEELLFIPHGLPDDPNCD